MKSNKVQVMSCGACAVLVGEDGTNTTSVDMLVNGIKRLMGKLSGEKQRVRS